MCAAVCAVNSFYVAHVMMIIEIRMRNVLKKDYSLFNRRDWAKRFGYLKTALILMVEKWVTREVGIHSGKF
jgi:hypothetical protein